MFIYKHIHRGNLKVVKLETIYTEKVGKNLNKNKDT